MAGLWCVGLVHTGARRMIDTSFSYYSYLILAYQNGKKYFLRSHNHFCPYAILQYFPICHLIKITENIWSVRIFIQSNNILSPLCLVYTL